MDIVLSKNGVECEVFKIYDVQKCIQMYLKIICGQNNFVWFLESEQGVFYHVKELWDSNIENIYGRQFVEYSIDKAIGKYIIFIVLRGFYSYFYQLSHMSCCSFVIMFRILLIAVYENYRLVINSLISKFS